MSLAKTYNHASMSALRESRYVSMPLEMTLVLAFPADEAPDNVAKAVSQVYCETGLGIVRLTKGEEDSLLRAKGQTIVYGPDSYDGGPLEPVTGDFLDRKFSGAVAYGWKQVQRGISDYLVDPNVHTIVGELRKVTGETDFPGALGVLGGGLYRNRTEVSPEAIHHWAKKLGAPVGLMANNAPCIALPGEDVRTVVRRYPRAGM